MSSHKFINKIRTNVRILKGIYKFYEDSKSANKTEMFLAIFLASVVVITETLGVALAYPVLVFIETDGDVEKFSATSTITFYVAKAYTYFGAELKLPSLMVSTFSLISVRVITAYFYNVYIQQLKWTVGKRLGLRLMDNYFNSNINFARDVKSGEITSAIEFEVQACAALLNTLISIFQISLSFLLYFSLVFIASPGPALILVSFLLIVSWMMRSLFKKTHAFSEQSIIQRRKMFNWVAEKHLAWRLIKITNNSQQEISAFEEMAQKLVNFRVDMEKIGGKISLIFLPIALAFLFVTLYVLVTYWSVKIGVLMIFGMIMMRLIPITQTYQKQTNQIAKLYPSISRINSFYSNSSKHYENVDAGQKISSLKTKITFHNVSFKYSPNDNYIFQNLSFDIPVGKFTSIVGPSGSGKSTILDLISGLLKPTTGQILFDDKNLKKLSLKSLRGLIAYIDQEPIFFDDTIKNNLLYEHQNATSSSIQQVLEQVNLWDHIIDLPEGLETRLSDRGLRFSVGQRQRLAIARGILGKKKIFMFDEPTSALDAKSEITIIRLLENLVKNNFTVVVVAHRLNTIKASTNFIKLK